MRPLASKMPLYSFQLGRKYLLSIAEIIQTFGEGDEVLELQKDSLICSLKEPLSDPQASLNRLGGTIKIAEIFSELPEDKNLIAPEISRYLSKKFENRIGKLSYGISIHSFTQRHEQFLKTILKKIKTDLENKGIKNRFVNRNFQNLQNAAIKGEKLLQKGAEIIIIEGKNKYYLAETKALQDFENYSHRDYDRPARDPRLGMLPPKVAQLMINFAGLDKLNGNADKKTLYDPFCGIGTVLSEALLKGFNIIGSDINPEIVEKARQNTEWLVNQTPELQRQKPNMQLFTQDAGKLSKNDQLQNIDCIVTESYLGPPVSQFPPENNREKTFQHIKNLTLSFFKAVQPLIKPGTPVIISFPFYRNKNTFFFIENLPQNITNLGFSIEPLLSKSLRDHFNISMGKRESLIYDRPDQVVGREIWKFVKK